MGEALLRGLKRLVKVGLAGAMWGAVYVTTDFLKGTPLGVFVIPLCTALTNAAAKFIKVKLGLKEVPF